MTRHTRLVVLAAAALLAGAAHAGTAQVRFIDPDRYTDADRAAFGSVERQRTLDALTRQFQVLAARHLGADQILSVEMLDIDLAGELRMAPRAGLHDTRVLKGRADVPRLEFRYRLQRGDQLLASGQERLTDLGYLGRTTYRSGDDAGLAHERRLLERWFVERFDSPSQRQ